MDSDELNQWQQLHVEETGGFAGLRRGCTVARGDLPAAQARRVASVLAGEGTRRGEPAAPMPDSQTLRLTLTLGGRSASWCFDTADLPDAVAELVGKLPPMKPLPPQ